ALYRQRPTGPVSYGSRNAPALGASGCVKSHRHQIWLRHGGLRRLHRQHRRQCGEELPGQDRTARRQCRHDHRSAVARPLASGPASLGGRAGAAMRLLPVGHDHGRGRPARQEPGSHGRGHRRRDHEHLPLRHLPSDSRSGAPRRPGQIRAGADRRRPSSGDRSGGCRPRRSVAAKRAAAGAAGRADRGL
ncbi:MAG: Isoquinoline 1-oxidoreductase alpha subunit, partial [uncultured Sphingosinicella sp.]